MFQQLLTNSKYKLWRYLLVMLAILSTTLSHSFFVFGRIDTISTSYIYFFGIGMAIYTLIIIYFNIQYVAPRYLARKEYASYILLLSLLVFGLVFAKGIVAYYMFQQAGVTSQWNAISVLDGLSNMVLFTICVASTSTEFIFRQLMDDQTTIQKLESRQLRSSIDKIKNSIQPSFLYATLDHTATLVRPQPRKASETLYKLSEHLRYQLYDSARSNVLLTSEIAFIQNYLLLHQQNSRGSFSFDLSVIGNSTQLIRPATLTPCIDELIQLEPKELTLTFEIDKKQVACNIHATMGAISTLMGCETLQKLHWIYRDSIRIETEPQQLKIHLKLC